MKAILTEKDGSKKTVFIQERGSVVSRVSTNRNGSFKTNFDVLTSDLKQEDEDNFSESSGSSNNDYSDYSSTHFDEDGEFLGGSLKNL
jgi:hypothetical protein